VLQSGLLKAIRLDLKNVPVISMGERTVKGEKFLGLAVIRSFSFSSPMSTLPSNKSVVTSVSINVTFDFITPLFALKSATAHCILIFLSPLMSKPAA